MSAGRYSRQELFAPIGPEGQARLRRSRVAVVGCGALGSTLAEIMVRAGVGGNRSSTKTTRRAACPRRRRRKRG